MYGVSLLVTRHHLIVDSRVIRLNPDTVVYDETRLRRLMAQPSAYGVFANCLNTFCDQYATRPCSEKDDFHLMTDFLGFRPDKALYDRWFDLGVQNHAETWCTFSFDPIVRSGNFSWIQSYSNTTACRIAQEDIGHTHEYWAVKLDYVLAGRSFCPGQNYAPCN